MNVPDREGIWLHEPTGQEIDIYVLDPMCSGILCLWGPDVGLTYSAVAETQGVWDSDEWQGHIPAARFDNIGPWKFIRQY